MKTSRRKFFGLIGGAAVAGPAAAKTAVAQLPTGLFSAGAIAPLSHAPQYIGEAACGTTSGRSWHLDEIARLKRLLSGDLTEEEKEQRRRSRLYNRHQSISNHWAGMQSVAAWRKVELFQRDMERVNDEISRSESESYLARLLRENGL